jgi:APA family basic amino acid/polyamine antiporter
MSNQQVRGLGLWMLTALVAGNMIGSGIFLLPASLASYGSISLFSWVFTSIGAVLIALVFAKLASIFPRTGGPYAYCREAYGNFVGFQMAYNYWIALWVGNAAIAVAFTGYLGVFFHPLQNNPILSFFVSAGAVWLMTIINAIGVRHAGMVQLITTVLKLLPLLLIASLGLLFLQPHNFADFNISGKSNLSALTGAATLTLWAFVGLESATVPAESVQNPQRNIPRATILGVLITSVIYILSSVAVMGVIPAAHLAHSTAPYADAARIMFGPVGSLLVAAGAVISCFGALNGWTLLQGQVPLAAARDGLFPKVFAQQSNRGTPVFGLIFTSVLITLLLLLTLNKNLVQQFTFIILLATLASLIPYFFTTIAELLIFIRDRERFNGKRLAISSAIAILAAIYAFWTIIGSGEDTVFYGTLLFFTSVPVYAWMKYSTRRAIVNENITINETA